MSHKRKQGIARFVTCTFRGIADTMVFKEVRKMNQIKIGQFLKELRKEKGKAGLWRKKSLKHFIDNYGKMVYT